MAGTDIWRRRCRIGLAAFYATAGILHVLFPRPFLSITPAWVPDAADVIFLTGLCEIAGAVALLVPQMRKFAGIALALYALCVFPANIKHALDSLGGPTASPWQWLYHGVRLPLQPLIIWLGGFVSGAVSWPFKRTADSKAQT